MITANDNKTDAPQPEPCKLTADEILEVLRVVEDPDLGISIVDLGLIYKIVNDSGNLSVDMTLTSPGCPYGPQLISEVDYMLHSLEGVGTTNVEVVWDPPWSFDNMSEDVKLELGMDI